MDANTYELIFLYIEDAQTILNLRASSKLFGAIIDNNMTLRMRKYANIGQCIDDKDIEVFKILVKKIDASVHTHNERARAGHDIFMKCVRCNNLECLEIAFDTFGNGFDGDVLRMAASMGNIDVLHYMLTKRKCRWSKELLILSAQHGKIPVLCYGLNIGNIRSGRKYAIPEDLHYYAINGGNYEYFEYLVTITGINSKMKWLCNMEMALSRANDTRYIELMCTKGFALRSELYVKAFNAANIELLFYLLEKNIPINETIYHAAFDKAISVISRDKALRVSQIHAKFTLHHSPHSIEVKREYIIDMLNAVAVNSSAHTHKIISV